MSKITLTLFAFLFIAPLYAQTKKIKRPKNRVGISSVDGFVQESFDLYDKVYRYDGYAAAGKSLEDEDIDVLEDALEDVSNLSTDAPDILTDLDGEGALKQGKAALQINRAKKALKYSIKTSKELLLGKRQVGDKDEAEDEAQNETASDAEDITSNDSNNPSDEPATPTFKVNSKFDFVPGDELLFFDDFSADFIGDFPSKWNTNGSGEIVTINNDPQRWLEFKPGYNLYYLPNLDGLPEEYTIEFDTFSLGLDAKTSSQAYLQVQLSDDAGFNNPSNSAIVFIPYGQFSAFKIRAKNDLKDTGRTINSAVESDIRKAVLQKTHFSFAINKERLRFWVNDKKYLDIPKMLPDSPVLKAIRFSITAFKDGKEQVFIGNLKVAKGGLDLRRTLMSTGKVSTNGILFESGSAVIQPQSYGILRQISQVLQQDNAIKLRIVGHTDSDGSVEGNVTLSQKRAQAVKTALEKTYGVNSNRLIADGKGASEPVAENNSPDGKAKNRRVEFIKQ